MAQESHSVNVDKLSAPGRTHVQHKVYDKNYSAMLTAIIQARYTTSKSLYGSMLTGESKLPTGVVNPFSVRYNVWLAFTILAAAFTGWFEVYMMAFADRPGLYPPLDGKCIVEYILFVIFGLDMLLHFRVAIMKGAVVISHPRSIARAYGGGRFLVDLLSVVPFDYIVLACLGQQDASQRERPGVSALKLLRVIRMYRLRYFFDFLAVHPNVPYPWLVIIRNYTIVFYVVHFAGSMLYYIARLQHFSAVTWVAINQDRFATTGQLGSYLYSMYWAMTTLTSIGYGDLHPYSVPEVAFVVAFQAFTIVLSAYLMATVTSLVIKSDSFTSRYHDRLKDLLHFSRTHSLPQDMEHSLANHLRLHLGSEAASDAQILSIYPTAIRKRVLRHMYRSDFAACYLFRGCPGSFIDKLIIAASIEMYMPDVDIITRGESVDHLFILVAGTAELATSSLAAAPSSAANGAAAAAASPEHRAVLLQDGSVFGELAFFLHGESLDTVTTISVCRVLTMSRKAYGAVQEHFPDGARAVLQNLYSAAVEAARKQEDIGLPLSARSTVWAALTPGGLQRQHSSHAPSDSFHAPRRSLQESTDHRVMWRQEGKKLQQQLHKVKQLLERHDQQHPPEPGDPPPSHIPPPPQGQARAALQPTPAPQHASQQQDKTGSAAHGGVQPGSLRAAAAAPAQLLAEGAGSSDQGGVKEGGDLQPAPAGAAAGGQEALVVAAAEERVREARALLAAGVDCSGLDERGRSALLEAATGGLTAVLDLLLASGARVRASGEEEGILLCRAAHSGSTAALRRLLQAGASAQAADYDGRTALHVAAAAGSLDMVRPPS